MTSVDFGKLAPTALWRRFAELLAVPRPSKDEAAAIEYVRRWADEHQFEALSDEIGNLCVHVPASRGAENAAPVVIQGHVDIVVADAENAPPEASSAAGKIPVVLGEVDSRGIFSEASGGGWLGAPFTTLGADNGIGCAAAMAVAEMGDVRKPPLQLLFTVDEEQGMTGALKFDPEALKITARKLINLDTEDDTDLTIGCAGGRDTRILWKCRARAVNTKNWAPVSVQLRDLRGGHSGLEINAGRCNAIRAMARALQTFAARQPLRIGALEGGEKSNAIPRSCRAVAYVQPADVSQLRSHLQACSEQLTEQFAGRDGPVRFQAEAVELAGDAFDVADSSRLLDLILGLPDGVAAMTPEIPELPETSNNVAIVRTAPGEVSIHCSSRSSQPQGIADISASLDAVARLAGATTRHGAGYPGWKPNVDSPLLKQTADVYRRIFQEEPHILAVHAGLECGVLGARLAGLDSISFGPNIRGNHAPGEHVEIASVEKSFQLLLGLLSELADQE